MSWRGSLFLIRCGRKRSSFGGAVNNGSRHIGEEGGGGGGGGGRWVGWGWGGGGGEE